MLLNSQRSQINSSEQVMDIQGKTIVITGAAQGLGLTMAIKLAELGANLALIDLNETSLSKAKDQCQSVSTSNMIQTYTMNVANESDVISTFSQITGDFGQIHGLVNNAGILRDGLLVKAKEGSIIDEMSLEKWQSVIDVNLTGVFLCGREAAKQMIAQKTAGVIVNISSISRAGNIGQSNYSAAKAGVAALTVCWARELARFQIRVAGIAPGFIETEMTKNMKPEALEKMTAGIPLKRMGAPVEIAQTVQFILENDYLSGRIIEIDGALRL